MDIPIVYYPLTVLCVDDEQLMLTTLKNYIEGKFPVQTAVTPLAAQQMLDNNVQKITQYLNGLIIKNHSPDDEIQLNIKLENLLSLSNDDSKHTEIGIMLVDFMMPEIDGIEFCKFNRQNYPDLKNILLTGHQDYQRVLNAFSKDIIDAFLQKSQENLFSELISTILDLNTLYFLRATQQLRTIIETHKKLPISEDKFKGFFNKIIQDMEIKKWFLLDLNGSFLFVNSKNNSFYFVVHTEESLNEFTSLYSEPEFYPFVDQIKNRNKIPFFGSAVDPANIEVTEWNSRLFTPQIFIGTQIYYWTIINKEEFL